MSTGTPFIGSKISLISKAEIRYEGILYHVDTKDSTVTLAKVRSFGTEGRPVQKHIPPRSETYEFIIFRGSDIKDLNVEEVAKTSSEESTTPQDPAILSAQSMGPASSVLASQTPPFSSSQPAVPPPSMPPSSHPLPQPIPPIGGGTSNSGGLANAPAYAPFPPPNIGGFSPFGMPYFRPPHMMPGPGGAPPPHAFGPLPPAVGAPPPHAGPPGGIIGTSPLGGGSHPPPQAPGSNNQLQQQQGVVPSSQPLLPHPPAPTSNPSSQAQLPFFTPPPPPQIITPPKVGAVSVASMIVSATPSAVGVTGSDTKPKASSTPLVVGTPQNSAAETTPKASLPLDSESPSAVPSNVVAQPPTQVDQPPNQTSAAAAPSSMEKHVSTNNANSPEGRPQAQYATSKGGVESHRNANGGEKRRHHQSNNSQQNRRGYQGRDYRGPPHGGRQQGQRRGGGSSGVFRYDSDFDFESANARFNKEGLEEEFKQKLSIDDHSSTHSRRTSEGNEGAESPTSDDVIVEDIAGEIDGEDEGGAEGDFYDKTKSFFDNISCEANTPGANHRPSRNEEREMNTETFGVSSVRGYGYRGFRRGRGRGGRGRGSGGYYRGGGGRNYYGGRGRGSRGGGGYYQQKGRGSSNNRRGGRGQDGSQYRRTQDQ